MILRPALCLWLFLLLFTGYSNAQAPVFYFCGKANNDLFQVLKSEALAVKRFDEVSNTIRAANKGALVFVIADGYPKLQPEKVFRLPCWIWQERKISISMWNIPLLIPDSLFNRIRWSCSWNGR